GDKIFQKIVEEYKNKTKDLPSIQGIDRNSPKAYSVLYEKGPLILYEFEELVGKDLFFNFLKEAAKSKIATTSDLLNLTEKLLSKEVRSWLEIKLKT
ncbi:MAG: hypothetical protein WAM24_18460, partial [Ignavibacteriaceae bacterium]